ncbi:Lsr2 family protein [Actinomyces sp. B33]|uniref:histone-like nucleoid-structuring protein Lsr2 n=1 Tax=Actinomyces sp. B33 TaxID=2942131 RepID=UPI0023415038|nr:Lsr2 family protein [Actinomyces sp. B33]MDC4232380.1 Lsr2 family protein [Actinomyces sp. B33]
MKKTRVELVDDIDGTIAARTVSFAFDGVSYEIDLSEENISEFRDALGRWIDAGRRTGGRAVRSRKASSAIDSGKIREWARANGIEVSDRGRIPAEIVEKYTAATK